jgi:hypothetical protein
MRNASDDSKLKKEIQLKLTNKIPNKCLSGEVL